MAYLLAIASPTHPVPAKFYYTGWAASLTSPSGIARIGAGRHRGIITPMAAFTTDSNLTLGKGNGADLFFTQFSFMGFDPRGKRDRYTDYFRNNRNIALINHAYCAENQRKYIGYGPACWGLSAGANSGGGRPLPRTTTAPFAVPPRLARSPTRRRNPWMRSNIFIAPWEPKYGHLRIP